MSSRLAKYDIYRCGSVTRKILRTKTGFLYEGLTFGDSNREEEERGGEDLMEALGAAPRYRRQRGAADEREKCELNPRQLMDHFRSVYIEDPELLNSLFPVFKQSHLSHPTDLLFLEVLAVPPPRYVILAPSAVFRNTTAVFLFINGFVRILE
jgi:hypothetical protein